jgi:hypothetical protein
MNIFKIWGRETSTARFNPMSNPHNKASVTFHAEHSFAKPKNYSASQEFPAFHKGQTFIIMITLTAVSHRPVT